MNRTVRNFAVFILILCSLMVSQAAVVITTEIAAGTNNSLLSVDLTADGATEWAIWEADSLTPSNTIAGGLSDIGALTYTGTQTPLGASASGQLLQHSYTNGVSPVSVSTSGTRTYMNTAPGQVSGDSFTLTVDASSQASSSLYLLLTGQRTTANLTATLDSGGSASLTNFAMSGGNNYHSGYYRIDYTGQNASDLLTITFSRTVANNTDSKFGVGAAALTVIPEPSSIALMGIALISLLALRRRAV